MLAEVCYDPQTGRGCPLKLKAALGLTFYQIQQILFADRDKETGKLVIEPDAQSQSMTQEERFTWWWVMKCLPRWMIPAKWRQEQQAQEQGNGGW